MKTRDQIRSETPHEEAQRVAPGQRLQEWDSSLPAGQSITLKDWEPLSDRIIVRLLPREVKAGAIQLTDPEPLIGGACRNAVVLRCGPGKWVEGEWWKTKSEFRHLSDTPHAWNAYESHDEWTWFPGHRREVVVKPGDQVLIGNWVDLESGDVVLCQEGDVRAKYDNPNQWAAS